MVKSGGSVFDQWSNQVNVLFLMGSDFQYENADEWSARVRAHARAHAHTRTPTPGTEWSAAAPRAHTRTQQPGEGTQHPRNCLVTHARTHVLASGRRRADG